MTYMTTTKFFIQAAMGSLILSSFAQAQIPERMADENDGTGYIGVTGILMSESSSVMNSTLKHYLGLVCKLSMNSAQ